VIEQSRGKWSPRVGNITESINLLHPRKFQHPKERMGLVVQWYNRVVGKWDKKHRVVSQ